jgi:hypothetical protein
VHYDLGEIQNGWGLRVDFANPLDDLAEIVLFQEDSQVGPSKDLLDEHSPRTAIEIEQPRAPMLEGKCMSSRLDRWGNTGGTRSDTFQFNRNPGTAERCWGTARIKVDDKSYECVLPSSLFKSAHGNAAPHQPALAPGERER